MHLLSFKKAFRARHPSKLHRQLIRQHHLQCHLHCGNDPTVTNHNGIPSVTHPPAPLAIPFILRERSTVANHNGILRMHEKQLKPHLQYGTDPSMIRDRSEHDPTTHETVSHPSHSRGRSSRFVDTLCMEKHRVSYICYLSHLLSFKNAFRARLPSKLHRQLIRQHHLQCHLHCGNDPTVANHNGIPSATHPPAPLAIPFTLRERSYSCKSQWNSTHARKTVETPFTMRNRSEMIRDRSEHDPRPIRT